MKPMTVALLSVGLVLFGQFAIAVESDASIIEQTYNDWVRVTNAKDIELWSSYLAPEAVFQPPGSPLLETRDAIIGYYQLAFADPNFALDCQQLAVEVANSGEMAWARGVCRATFTDSDGQLANGTSKWFKVWLKQADGLWKCKLNTWHNDQ